MSDIVSQAKKMILLIGDIGAFYLALYLTLAIRYGYPVDSSNWDRHLLLFSIVFIVWIAVMFINDFYDLKTSYNTSNLLSGLSKIFIINGAVAIALFYFVGPIIDSIRPQRVLIINVLISFSLIFTWRKIFYQFIKSSKIANTVLILGKTNLSLELFEQIQKRPQLGYQAIMIESLPADLGEFCDQKNVNILINALSLRNDEVSRKIFKCLALGIDVYSINNFYEQIINKIPVEYISHDWFLENLSEHSKKLYEITKRLSDVMLSITGLIIAIPLSPIISLLIKTESPGPVIFKQIRTGKNGKDFTAMKFRSMIDGAEKDGAQWASKNDTRVTRFGSFMRKTRLDEIPQLVNVLRGEMSLIGPRPERPEFITILEKEIPFYRERLLVKPGLAGWAQLKGPTYGGSKEESLEKLKYDLYYIKNRSILLDISILLKTIKVVIGGKGQ